MSLRLGIAKLFVHLVVPRVPIECKGRKKTGRPLARSTCTAIKLPESIGKCAFCVKFEKSYPRYRRRCWTSLRLDGYRSYGYSTGDI